MLIDNAAWHARVGGFYALKPILQYKLKTKKVPFSFQTVYFSFLALSYIIESNVNSVRYVFNWMVTKNISLITKLLKIFLFVCIVNLLCCCGDIETNLGSKYSFLTFCHWNLNGLTAHDSMKISFLQANFLQHIYDIICLSEVLLNSSIGSNDDRISIHGCNLIRLDHPSDSKRGGVRIYYKEHIPLIKRGNICTLDNCLVTEICSKGEKYFLSFIYCSPTQSHDECENFCINFELRLNNINDEFPICSIVTGDFNTCCSSWWKNDITNTPGQEIASFISSAGFAEFIDK